MKRALNIFIQLIIFWLIGATVAMAGPAGKIEFADLSSAYGTPKVEINLNKALLSMVTAFTQGEDPELVGLLSKIDEVTVRVYSLEKGAEKANQAVDSLTKTLRSKQWQPFVSVNEDTEKVRIYGRSTDGIMDGLVVMVVGGDKVEGEAVFINIVGEIDPQQISRVTKALNVNYGTGEKK